MALTSYMVRIVILDLLFSHYSLGLELAPLEALGAGLAFFGVNAASSERDEGYIVTEA